MFEKMTEQFQNSMAQVNDLIASNAKVMVKLTKQQTKLFTDVVNENVAYTKNLSEQTDLPGVLNVQKAHAENVRDTLLTAGEETNKLFSEVQEKAGETVKPFFNQEKTATTGSTKSK